MHSGGMSLLRPISKLEVHLFRNGKGVINFDAEISDGAFNLSVAKQQLDGTQVAGPAVDQRRLCSSQRMGAEQVWVQPDTGNPLR